MQESTIATTTKQNFVKKNFGDIDTPTKEFYNKLSELEYEFIEGKTNGKKIKYMSDMYLFAVEHFKNSQDPIERYFLDKIQLILHNPLKKVGA